MQNRGIKLHLSHFLVFALRADGAGSEELRLGITVTKKVGHAVFRNQIKRWVREAFRQERACFVPGWDLVFIAKRQCVNAEFHSVLRDVRSAARQIQRRCPPARTLHPESP